MVYSVGAPQLPCEFSPLVECCMLCFHLTSWFFVLVHPQTILHFASHFYLTSRPVLRYRIWQRGKNKNNVHHRMVHKESHKCTNMLFYHYCNTILILYLRKSRSTYQPHHWLPIILHQRSNFTTFDVRKLVQYLISSYVHSHPYWVY